MQVFLPYADFARSAQVLDYRRLGKQRVECLQILNALTGQSKGWVNHPIVRAWRGHEFSLACYGVAIIQEWIRRGYNDTCMDKIVSRAFNIPFTTNPPWLGDEPVHSAYRSLLIYKDPEWYGQWGWSEEPAEKIDYKELFRL